VSADFSINADSSGEDKRPRIAMIARWNRYGRNGEWNARNDRTHASTVTTALRVLFSREKIMQAGSREGFDSTLSHHTFSPRRSRESQNVCRALGSSKSSFVFHRKRAARARKRERERERKGEGQILFEPRRPICRAISESCRYRAIAHAREKRIPKRPR